MDGARQTGTPHRATVWFDGDCPLCAREIALMRRWDRDRAITFVDLAISPGCPPVCPLDRAAMIERLHAQEEGGPMVSGAEAFAVMWRCIPGFRPLGRLARRGVALWLLERAYRVFLILRPTLQTLARLTLGPAGPAKP